MSETGQIEFTSSCTSSTFIWKIENFSSKCSTVGEYIVSPDFISGDCNNKIHPKWILHLFPFGHSDESKDYISVYLQNVYLPTLERYICSLEISIYDSIQTDMNTRKHTHIFTFGIGWGWPKFIKRSDLFEKETSLLKQDTLIIACSICDSPLNAMCHCVRSFTDKYESLYLSKDFSDITVVIDDKKINVHKAILSARSKVFSAMLKNDMAEENINLIEISDVEYTVMEKFLLYLYSGRVNDIEKFAMLLLPIADKYIVDDLKIMCANTLSNRLTTENACELLSIADLYNCIILKNRIIDFIVSHVKEIIKTQGFKDLSSSNQVLVSKLFYEVVEKKL